MHTPHETLQRLNAGIFSICLVGIGLSYYAYSVETTKEHDKSYEALCDISEHVSCTKAFMSKYGKGFGLIPKDSPLYMPNSIYGLVFYTIVSSLSLFNRFSNTIILLILGVSSNISSIYLGYILYLIKDICVICVGLYIVNIIILVLSVKKLRVLFQKDSKKKKLH